MCRNDGYDVKLLQRTSLEGKQGYLIGDNTGLGFVLKGLVCVQQLQQLISTQIAAALVHCFAVEESSLHARVL